MTTTNEHRDFEFWTSVRKLDYADPFSDQRAEYFAKVSRLGLEILADPDVSLETKKRVQHEIDKIS